MSAEFGFLKNACRKLGEAYETKISVHKPQRKESGKYYTPDYIVDFIVDETIGPLIEEYERNGQDLLSIRILDPAMGCGYFLAAAAEYLANAIWSKNPDKDRESVIAEVLENCIFGIDIDEDAVFIASEVLQGATLINANALTDYCSLNLDRFDAVIGNPPYLFGENIPGKEVLKTQFSFAKGQFDVYWLFYEMAIKHYLKDGGRHGYIVPDAILARDETSIIRKELTNNHCLCVIMHSGEVFSDPMVSTAVIIWQKKKVVDNEIDIYELKGNNAIAAGKFKQRIITNLPKCRWLINTDESFLEELNDIYEKSTLLGEIVKISRGEEIGKSDLVPLGTPNSVPVLSGIDIKNGKEPNPSKAIPANLIKKDLSKYKSPKIVFVKTGKSIVASVDYSNSPTLQSVYNIHITDPQYSPEYICSILNSDLLNKIAQTIFTDYKKTFPQFNQSTIKELPLPNKK